MTKTFCDRCGKEVKRIGKFHFKLGDYELEIMECVKSVWNGGDLCFNCVKEIIKEGEVTDK